jgi:tetraacyldisaccharide 4'-kinase
VPGAWKLVEEGVDLIIMDDGFQSARLTLDFALVVIDTVRGIGNGHLVPAGPVRAPIGEQMRQLSAILKVGNGTAADMLVRQAARAGKRIQVASLKPRENREIAGKQVFAFAGIADPNKFYRTVKEAGGLVTQTRDFPDHHYFTEDEVADLLDDAAKRNLALVTTAKDAVRLTGHSGRMQELAQKTSVVEVDMSFDDPHAPGSIIKAAIASFRERRIKEGNAKKA